MLSCICRRGRSTARCGCVAPHAERGGVTRYSSWRIAQRLGSAGNGRTRSGSPAAERAKSTVSVLRTARFVPTRCFLSARSRFSVVKRTVSSLPVPRFQPWVWIERQELTDAVAAEDEEVREPPAGRCPRRCGSRLRSRGRCKAADGCRARQVARTREAAAHDPRTHIDPVVEFTHGSRR